MATKRIVGLTCVICREPIDSVDEGRFCEGCDYPVHSDCMQRPPGSAGEEICRTCGVDAPWAVAQLAWEQAEDQPPRKRVSVALHAAAEMLQGLGLALATDDMPPTE